MIRMTIMKRVVRLLMPVNPVIRFWLRPERTTKAGVQFVQLS